MLMTQCLYCCVCGVDTHAHIISFAKRATGREAGRQTVGHGLGQGGRLQDRDGGREADGAQNIQRIHNTQESTLLMMEYLFVICCCGRPNVIQHPKHSCSTQWTGPTSQPPHRYRGSSRIGSSVTTTIQTSKCHGE